MATRAEDQPVFLKSDHNNSIRFDLAEFLADRQACNLSPEGKHAERAKPQERCNTTLQQFQKEAREWGDDER